VQRGVLCAHQLLVILVRRLSVEDDQLVPALPDEVEHPGWREESRDEENHVRPDGVQVVGHSLHRRYYGVFLLHGLLVQRLLALIAHRALAATSEVRDRGLTVEAQPVVGIEDVHLMALRFKRLLPPVEYVSYRELRSRVDHQDSHGSAS